MDVKLGVKDPQKQCRDAYPPLISIDNGSSPCPSGTKYASIDLDKVTGESYGDDGKGPPDRLRYGDAIFDKPIEMKGDVEFAGGRIYRYEEKDGGEALIVKNLRSDAATAPRTAGAWDSVLAKLDLDYDDGGDQEGKEEDEAATLHELNIVDELDEKKVDCNVVGVKKLNAYNIVMRQFDGDLHDLFFETKLGRNLRRRLARRRWVAAQIVFAVREALDCLLAKGFVYTDLKPANILYRCVGKNRIEIALGDIGSIISERNDPPEPYVSYPLPEKIEGTFENRKRYHDWGAMLLFYSLIGDKVNWSLANLLRERRGEPGTIVALKKLDKYSYIDPSFQSYLERVGGHVFKKSNRTAHINKEIFVEICEQAINTIGKYERGQDSDALKTLDRLIRTLLSPTQELLNALRVPDELKRASKLLKSAKELMGEVRKSYKESLRQKEVLERAKQSIRKTPKRPVRTGIGTRKRKPGSTRGRATLPVPGDTQSNLLGTIEDEMKEAKLILGSLVPYAEVINREPALKDSYNTTERQLKQATELWEKKRPWQSKKSLLQEYKPLKEVNPPAARWASGKATKLDESYVGRRVILPSRRGHGGASERSRRRRKRTRRTTRRPIKRTRKRGKIRRKTTRKRRTKLARRTRRRK